MDALKLASTLRLQPELRGTPVERIRSKPTSPSPSGTAAGDSEGASMKTIWKFSLETTDTQTVDIPEGAEILDVQEQHGVPTLWAIVDPDAGMQKSPFTIVGTGHPLPSKLGKHAYIGTYQLHGGALVFHVFAG